MIASSLVAAPSAVRKRSIVIDGHKTSISLEDAFWSALRDIASTSRRTLSDIVTEIDAGHYNGNLSSAVRLHVLAYYRDGRPQ